MIVETAPLTSTAVTTSVVPRLTVHIVTRNSAARLPRLVAEARSYADEIVVAVDATSDDRTFEVASSFADVVYRFRLPQPGLLAPVRMLSFEYASGDWILSLDDDESMEPSFDGLVAELMRSQHFTHYYFPRKWIVKDEPCEYAHAHPWFPDWAPRLFRNDRSLLWKPRNAHTLERILGPGCYESRAAILHFEPLWCGPAERNEKIARYRAAGGDPNADRFYAVPDDVERRPAARRTNGASSRRYARAVVHDGIRELEALDLPPWSAHVLNVDMPEIMRAGDRAVVEVTVRNTGTLAWAPTYTQWPATPWPMLRLGHHLLSPDGAAIDWDHRPRTLLPRWIAPGEDVTFIVDFTAPERAGEYVIGWDMVSELHCWFSQCGSPIFHSAVSVRA